MPVLLDILDFHNMSTKTDNWYFRSQSYFFKMIHYIKGVLMLMSLGKNGRGSWCYRVILL